MIGDIIGNVVGSNYEFRNIKAKQFELFSKAVAIQTTASCLWPRPTGCCMAMSPLSIMRTGKKHILMLVMGEPSHHGWTWPFMGTTVLTALPVTIP